MGFYQNACKPEGLDGKKMIHQMNSRHIAMAEWGFSHITIHEGDAALDIGCGGGVNIKTLLEKSVYGKAKGIDYSEVSVEESRKMNEEAVRSGRCEILHGDVMDLPFTDASFHVVTAFETIYYWPDLSKAFAQVYRVLKENGIFMICNESNGEDEEGEQWAEIIEGMTVYNSEQIQILLQQAGFANIKIDTNDKGWLCAVGEKISR
uniref:class I SAM-dependent methyltransferase n=1 Tax=Faecalicatena contorta TaxID=39482 RepID=UPI00359C5701